jgi:hypothetical protein
VPAILNRAVSLLIFLAAFQALPAWSKIWFIAPDGLDANTGASNSPFATLTRAQSTASSGDTVYLRGGTYFLDNSNFTATNSPWAIVNNITKNSISYLAYPGELPVFDFSAARPDGWRVTAFLVTASSCVFQGFDVVGVPVTIQTNHTQSECFRVASTGANFNRFEQLRLHDGRGIGWYLTDGASNLVLNCDAWNNRGLDGGSLGNIDGFGCHPTHTSGKGNIIRGCRAWFNSDDGYDCINAFAVVTFDHCWSFYNGYFTNFSSSGGDGNGIKAGGYGVSGSKFPTPVPNHVVEFCLTVHNRASGFYANHHLDGQVWLNNTAYRNGTDFNMLCSTNNSSSTNDVPGFNHLMKNNLGFKGSTEVANLDTNKSNVSFNFFTLPVTVATNDFLSLNESFLIAPRQADGSLPYVNFLRLTNTSDCLNVGTNVTFPFYGTAPDLGAFEFGPTNPPVVAMAKSGTNLIFTTAGWANLTNYLVACTNLASSAPWTFLATNISDLFGAAIFTNPISPANRSRFYRISQISVNSY